MTREEGGVLFTVEQVVQVSGTLVRKRDVRGIARRDGERVPTHGAREEGRGGGSRGKELDEEETIPTSGTKRVTTWGSDEGGWWEGADVIIADGADGSVRVGRDGGSGNQQG